MQFLQSNIVTKDEAEDAHKAMLASVDMQTAFADITRMVESEECENYLIATSQWLEEKSIPIQLLSKYIPTTIIEKIKQDAYDDNLMRPSLKTKGHKSLDFLYKHFN